MQTTGKSSPHRRRNGCKLNLHRDMNTESIRSTTNSIAFPPHAGRGRPSIPGVFCIQSIGATRLATATVTVIATFNVNGVPSPFISHHRNSYGNRSILVKEIAFVRNGERDSTQFETSRTEIYLWKLNLIANQYENETNTAKKIKIISERQLITCVCFSANDQLFFFFFSFENFPLIACIALCFDFALKLARALTHVIVVAGLPSHGKLTKPR